MSETTATPSTPPPASLRDQKEEEEKEKGEGKEEEKPWVSIQSIMEHAREYSWQEEIHIKPLELVQKT